MEKNEGVIKYHCDWEKKPAISPRLCQTLLKARERLKKQHYIGADQAGIGFGNISRRWRQSNQFLITGSQTGHVLKLSNQHLSLVTGFDIDKNEVHCQGPTRASSEALSHGIIYESARWIQWVIHIHHQMLWDQFMKQKPVTPRNATYGSVLLASALARIVNQTPVDQTRLMALAGHEPGLILFGHDIEDMLKTLFEIDLSENTGTFLPH